MKGNVADMVTTELKTLPDDVRTNGASPNPWWAGAVVYQIYPRSFQDSNGDGIGDIQGIISRLDYLADLGVDVIWLSPVYKSPQDDNGYDISDYRDIDSMFGTLSDMDELLAKAHERGMKVIMDLVVNHTSDEHPWFQSSRDPDDPHADWYWWRPARPGHEPGTPGAEPNRWGAAFGGSAWQYDEKRGEYYLHLFSKKQPDLNWENPAVRHAVYDMMNWWMDRGIDGFRMDVITSISKTLDVNGRLPGEEGSLIEDTKVNEEGYTDCGPFTTDGPRQDEFLAEMRREVFDGREGFLTVGEAGVTPERNAFITDPGNGELDMLFLFNHLNVDNRDGSKWRPVPLDLPALKRVIAGQQEAVRGEGWATVFFDNHDQPRVVSRWGDDSSEKGRVASAKALALLLLTHRGTPYVYEGEELGMTNAHFTSLDQYRDIESINDYHQRVDEKHVQSAKSMLAAMAARSRDNARTPMQWDDSKYAGFMNVDNAHNVEDKVIEPWISVNPNHTEINAASQMNDPDSVRSFFKRLIAFHHSNQVIIAGDWQLLDPDDTQIYAFTRTLGERSLLVVVNLSGRQARVPYQTWALLNGVQKQGSGVEVETEAVHAGIGSAGDSLPEPSRFLVCTGDTDVVRKRLSERTVDSWQGFVVEL